MTAHKGYSVVRVKVKSKINVRVKAYLTFSHNQQSATSHNQPLMQKPCRMHDALCVFVQ